MYIYYCAEAAQSVELMLSSNVLSDLATLSVLL